MLRLLKMQAAQCEAPNSKLEVQGLGAGASSVFQAGAVKLCKVKGREASEKLSRSSREAVLFQAVLLKAVVL